MITETTMPRVAAPASDHPALARLARLDREWFGDERQDATPTSPPRVQAESSSRSSGPWMGYQPGLDGLRAVSVIAVMLYHAGFGWMKGGFFGVEVFFVVSGFLITSLLIEERSQSGAVSLSQFWMRRARRLLPALGALLVAVAVWGAVFGTAEQRSQLRRDFPWSIFYVSNWGQIVGDVPYYSGDPPLLRHLWSLAVEEQWYLLWPLAFVALAAWRGRSSARGLVVFAAALMSMAFTFWLHAGGPGPIRSSVGVFDDVDRVNFMYLSTPTRASGLLLGAAAAFVWRPWRTVHGAGSAQRALPGLDAVGGIAVGGLACIFAVARLTDGYVYQWLLPLVSLLSVFAVMVVVHPWASGMRRVFGWRPLVEIGKRSYGLYLWHWPIFVIADAPHRSVARVAVAGVITVVVSELCYRFVETPVRHGALGRWWRGNAQRRTASLARAGLAVAALVVFYASVDRFDRAAGGEDATFEIASTGTQQPAGDPRAAPTDEAGAAADPAAGAAVSGAPASAPPTTPPAQSLPRSVAIVGDSQAHSLYVNTPGGLDATLTVVDGSIDGCSVYDSGGVQSARPGFDNSFSICTDWQSKWASAASQADVALVVLGAWDVFDLETSAGVLAFGTPEWDDYFVTNLRAGIDAMRSSGAQVALLEIACMRPQDVEGAGVSALPERGDDARVAHVNDLMRSLQGDGVTFVEGPDAWCNDETVSTDLGMRWDGVHAYKPGAKLIYETIAPALIALPDRSG